MKPNIDDLIAQRRKIRLRTYGADATKLSNEDLLAYVRSESGEIRASSFAYLVFGTSIGAINAAFIDSAM